MARPSDRCHSWISSSGDDVMPAPLAIAAAVGAGIISGYLIDHLVGDGQYTAEEAVLDASLGLVGGSLVKPALRIGSRLKRAERITAGRPTTMERVFLRAQTTPITGWSTPVRLAYTGQMTLRHSGRDLSRLARFGLISGGHSYWVSTRSRGSGAPSGSSSIRTNNWTFYPHLGGSKVPKSARTTYKGKTKRSRKSRKSARRSRCPPGHYWSKRKKKCVRYSGTYFEFDKSFVRNRKR